MVTVINDAAENSGLLSNNPCAQGAFEGRGPVAKETDDIQNGPRSTVSFSLFLPTNRFLFCFFLPQFLLLLFRNQLPHDLFEDFGDFGKFVFVRRFGAAVSFIFVSVLIS